MDQHLRKNRLSNPQQASILSQITFSYTFSTFIKAFRTKNVSEEDVPDVLPNNAASKLGDSLEKNWKEQKTTQQPSLWKAIGRTFGLEFITFGFGLIFNDLVLRLLRPVALVQLIQYVSQNEDSRTNIIGAQMYGGFIVGLSFLSVFFNQFSKHYSQVLGMKVRVACSSLIYRKTLRLSKTALDGVSIGHITNLLTNDLNRLDNAVRFAHYLWICPVEILLIMYVLYALVGVTSLVGILFMALLVPFLVFLGTQCSKLRLATAIRTDERVRLMHEIIAGIKVIKMYTWEKPFAELVDSVRRLEVHQILFINYIRAFMRFAIVTPKIGTFLSILTYVLTGNNVTAVYVFTVTCFCDNLKQTLVSNFIVGISSVSELRVSIKRLEHLLLLEEIRHRPDCPDGSNHNKPSISLYEVSAKWCGDTPESTLTTVTLNVGAEQHVVITGTVGSGKSSILKAILNELPINSGSIDVRGKISYAAQDPWVFSGNIRQNILFGQPFNLQRYNEVIKVCALEDDLALFSNGDYTLVGERGVILSGGQKARVNLARAIYMVADIYLLDDPFSAVDIHVANQIFQQCLEKFLKHKCVILVTYHLRFLNRFDCIHLLERGRIKVSGTYNELKVFESIFTPQLQNLGNRDATCSNRSANEKSVVGKRSELPDYTKEHRSTGNISGDVFMTYLRSGGSTLKCVAIVFMFITSQIAFTATDYITAYWVNEEQKADKNLSSYSSRDGFIYIYTGTIIFMILSVLLRSYVLFNFFMQISICLHDKMFTNIVGTSLKFFHDNYSGRILNRFSKDMGIIDESLPLVIAEFVHISLTVLGCIIIICITNPVLLVVTVLLVVIFYFLRVIYLSTSVNLTRLEGTARSPVYGHINETFQGLQTIRACRAESILEKEFDSHQDWHSSVWFHLISCSRTFGLYIDFICVIYLSAIIFTALSQTEQYAGYVGLAITQGIGLLGMFQWGMIQSSELENQMTSVERVVEYIRIQPESTKDSCQPHQFWPKDGAIKFTSVFLRYAPEQPYILKDLSFAIEPRQKIGIVGRTGAGKSSLITALFQLTKVEGAIIVDNVDITKIPVHSIRSKISIIPQDPVLFSGTIRKNLDPFALYSDLDIWSALEDVQLKPVVAQLSHDLYHIVTDGGLNFSVGQRQLICLARAIIRKNKILILDEATANVDPHNDAIIQTIIRSKFVECTVLTIAHRLNTIIDSDKVLVMDAGKMVEYDHPYILLQNHNGVFYSMMQETGDTISYGSSKG